jgi:hypothetical protein
MTQIPEFGRLQAVSLREAWQHEAHHFTPWLAENLDRLSEAIGVSLELTGTEVAVGAFFADILARDSEGSVVLIENQLEQGNHGHLGQIMTYLAGLDAKIVIWVAAYFNADHLSAIRWLNMHTVPPYAFFAIKLGVVRIGQSPLAPLFDVLERPNDWDRTLRPVAQQAAGALTELGVVRREFWTHLILRHPNEANHGPANGLGYRRRRIGTSGLVVGQYIAKLAVGVYIGGDRSVGPEEAFQRLAAHAEALQARLGVPIAVGQHEFLAEKKLVADPRVQSDWDRLTDWLHTEADSYERALLETLGT